MKLFNDIPLIEPYVSGVSTMPLVGCLGEPPKNRLR